MRQLQPTKHDIVQWTEALRNGKYQQTVGSLESSRGLCCLGVACKVFIPSESLEVYTSNLRLHGEFPDEQAEAPAWLKGVNEQFNGLAGVHLSELNDDALLTFDEIADCLEAVYLLEVLS